MPTGSLKGEGKKLWEKVYNDAKAKGDDEEKAAKKAWGAIKAAGWRKDAKGQWHKGDLVEFSLAITKASYDPKTGERRWVATASDTGIDSYGDKMSMELFQDFIDRINRNEQAPEEFRTSFWSGGMPYLSVSHYPDLEGEAVPGPLDGVFISGEQFKSKGRFDDTPIGLAAYEAVKKDLLNKSENPVRISIAFLDYKHRHLSDGYVFERNLNDPKRMICPRCIEEAITGEYGGKEFLRGQLVHEAMTRVPVNKRTDMEVERSEMTTRKEDAASIIGEELAEELDEKAKLVGKSEALVIKADEEETEPVEEVVEEVVEPVEEDKVLAALSEMKAEIHDLISVIRAKMKKDDEEDMEEDGEDEEYKDKKKKKEEMKSEVVEVEPQPAFTLEMLSDAVRAGNTDMVQRLDILISSLSQNVTSSGVPQRRSMVPPPNYNPPVAAEPRNPNQPLSIGDFVRKSV